uniref:Uncharacterized protein n=1 Tax=Timema poppense TaxID=170557 RepID=A0A7R9H0D0_TIMPO|nr:unnamed protein product [Timema poppensis]
MNTRLTPLHGCRPQLSQLRTLHSQPQITRPASTTCHDRLIRRRPNVHAQNNPGQRTSGEKKRLFSPVSRLFPSGLETEGTTMIDIPNEETPLAGPVNNVILKPRSNVTPTPLNNISAKLSNSKTGKKYELVPPDGGWGWAIVASGSIIYSLVVPVPPLHSLFYKEIKKEVNLSATEIAIITNVPGGLFFIYDSSRKISFLKPGKNQGSVQSSTAEFDWFPENDYYWYSLRSFIIFRLVLFVWILEHFSITSTHQRTSSLTDITSLFLRHGIDIFANTNTTPALRLQRLPALKATNYISSLAMAMYGTRGAILVMAGLLLHGLVAAMLLQPVAWHMKREEVVDTGGQHKDEEQGNNILASTKLLAKNGELQENQSLEGSKETNENVSRDDSKETQICLLNSSGFHPNDFDKHRVYLNGNTTLKPQSAKRGNKGKLSSLAVGLDLGLLKDKTFLMLLTGIWLALAAETIFVFFTPFVLDDLGFTTEQITNILAVISGGDLLFRFLAPFIADWIKFDDKLMFVLSLVVAVLTRIRCKMPPPSLNQQGGCDTSHHGMLPLNVGKLVFESVGGVAIMLVTSYEAMLSVGLALGASKGIMMVYRALVIPNYVPMERVSSALALQMVGVGFTVLISSPFAGVLRDLSGSYNTSVTVVNVVTVLAILIYVVEINLSRRHNRRKPSR